MKDFVNFLPDMFEYEGPVDLTEYYVRRTGIDRDIESVFRVEVGNQTNGRRNNFVSVS